MSLIGEHVQLGDHNPIRHPYLSHRLIVPCQRRRSIDRIESRNDERQAVASFQPRFG